LLELIAIFTHDLSNPLQSITVLCELGLDDVAEGSDDQIRAEQCLEAAQRMRAILQGLGGLSRHTEGFSALADVVDRANKLLVRRFDRHNTSVDLDLGNLGGRCVARGFEFALLTIWLGYLSAAAEASAVRNKLSLRISGTAPGRCSLRIASEASDSDNHTEPLELAQSYAARAGAIITDLGGTLQVTEDCVMLDIPAVVPDELSKYAQ